MFALNKTQNKVAFQMNFAAELWSDDYYVDAIDFWQGIETCKAIGYEDITDSLSPEFIAALKESKKAFSKDGKSLLKNGTCINTAMVNPALRHPEKFSDPMAYFEMMQQYHEETGLICTYVPHAVYSKKEKLGFINEGIVLASYKIASDKGAETDVTKINPDSKYIFLVWCEEKDLITKQDLKTGNFMNIIQEQRHLDKINNGREQLHALMDSRKQYAAQLTLTYV